MTSILSWELEKQLKGIQDTNSVAYFWLIIFSLLFAADFQAYPTDISCKKYWKMSLSKIMQHCSYLGCPLIRRSCSENLSRLKTQEWLSIQKLYKVKNCSVFKLSTYLHKLLPSCIVPKQRFAQRCLGRFYLILRFGVWQIFIWLLKIFSITWPSQGLKIWRGT